MHGMDGLESTFQIYNPGRAGPLLSGIQSGPANDEVAPGKRWTTIQQCSLPGESLRIPRPRTEFERAGDAHPCASGHQAGDFLS